MTICKHFNFCGGCQNMDVEYNAQAEAKVKELSSLLTPFWTGDIKLHKSPQREFYRNKIEVGFCRQVVWEQPFDKKFKRDKTKPLEFESALGFKVKGCWDRAVDLQDCQIFEPYLIPLLSAVRVWAKDNNLEYYDQRKHTGLLRNIMLRQGKNTGQTMVVLVAAHDGFDHSGFVSAVQSVVPKANILLSINDGVADVAKTAGAKVLSGAPAIQETIELGADAGARVFQLSAQSFFQTNTKAAQEMYSTVREIVTRLSPRVIYDLYGGAGSFSITVADKVEKSFCVESVPEAVADGAVNAKLNNVQNVSFVCDKVEDYLRKNKLSKFESMIIVDPPRVGLHKDALSELCASGVQDVVYISCNPVTLARDLEEIVKTYRITNVEAFDFFPNTTHVETLVELKLK